MAEKNNELVGPTPAKPKGRQAPPHPAGTPAQRWLFLLVGMLAGAVIVLITLNFANRPTRVVTLPSQAGSGPLVAKRTGDAPPDLGSKPDHAAPPNSNTNPPKPGGVEPYNPFLPSPMPPKEITGRISPPGDLNISKAGSNSAAEDAAPKRNLLVTMRLDVGDPAGVLKTLQSIASKAGGDAIQYDEAAQKAEAEGAILFVPEAKAEDVEKQLGSLGTVVVKDHWTGTAAERIDRVERDAQDRLSDLRIQRQELVVKYFEDAPQIKHIDEDSARIDKSLAAFRKHHPGDGTAVVKVRFMSY